MRLTDIRVSSLAAPEKGAKIYYDETLKGFGVRVSSAGTKAFVLATGKNRDRTTIGRYPVISLQDARKRALQLMGEWAAGKRGPARMAFEDAIALFVAEKSRKNRASTITENERILRKYFVPLHRKNLADIGSTDISRILDKLSDTPGTALHAFWTLRTFLRWCYKRGYIDRNPIDRLDPPSSIVFRERVLTDDELCAVWTAADAVGGGFSAIVKLLILTGQRRSEIGSLRADYIKDYSVCLPSEITKNRRMHTFPIGALSEAILSSRITNEAATLFPAQGSTTTPFNGWSKAKAQLDQKAGIAPWVLHDLRRTFATGMQRLGVRIEVIEALLNHVSGTRAGIVGVYQRHHYQDEMLAAVELWEGHLRTILQMGSVEEL
jgi:integrase